MLHFIISSDNKVRLSFLDSTKMNSFSNKIPTSARDAFDLVREKGSQAFMDGDMMKSDLLWKLCTFYPESFLRGTYNPLILPEINYEDWNCAIDEEMANVIYNFVIRRSNDPRYDTKYLGCPDIPRNDKGAKCLELNELIDKNPNLARKILNVELGYGDKPVVLSEDVLGELYANHLKGLGHGLKGVEEMSESVQYIADSHGVSH